jgi:hypothetical protein
MIVLGSCGSSFTHQQSRLDTPSSLVPRGHPIGYGSVHSVGASAKTRGFDSRDSFVGESASESRDPRWIWDAYVTAAEVDHLLIQLQSLQGALIGSVGFQGVGKSSALLALSAGSREQKTAESSGLGTMLFKWRRTSDLFQSASRKWYFVQTPN